MYGALVASDVDEADRITEVCTEEESRLGAHVVTGGGAIEDANFVGLHGGGECGFEWDCDGCGVGSRGEEYRDAETVRREDWLEQAELGGGGGQHGCSRNSSCMILMDSVGTRGERGWNLARFFDRHVTGSAVGEDADEHEGTVVLDAIRGDGDALYRDRT